MADASSSTMVPEASVDAGPVTNFLNCGGTTCQPAGTLAAFCCANPSSTTSSLICVLGGGLCNSTCDSRLGCTSNDNCGSDKPQCCVGAAANTACSGNKVYASQCRVGCFLGEMALCNPNSPTCPSGKGCSTNASDLQAVGMPAGTGYGVCK